MQRPSRITRRLAHLLAGVAAVLVLQAGLATEGARAAEAGIQLHVLWSHVDQQEMERAVDQAADNNARMIRVDVGWSSLQSDGPGQWNRWHLDRLDALVDKAEQRGLKLLLLFSESPCWASSAPETLKQGCKGTWWDRRVQRYLPKDLGDYTDALVFLARRYGTRVAAWEMWNEPNLEYFLAGPDKARRYAALVKAAYPRAKAAAPHATFLAGSLSESDVEFTEDLYRAGIKGSFDAFSIHPYSHDASPLAPREGWKQQSFIRGVPAVRDAMLRFGDDKPLWLTEFGWSTNSVRGPDLWHNGVDESDQAKFVGQALDQIRAWSYVPVALYYNLHDLSTDKRDRNDNYGLLRFDGKAKPALAAFSAAAARLHSGAPPLPSRDDASEVPSLKVTVPGSGAPPAVSAPEATGDAGGASSTWMHSDEERQIAITRQTRTLVRANGLAPGERRVTVEVRRVRFKEGGTPVVGRSPVVRLKVPVRGSGRYAASFSVKRLLRGTYRVALRGVDGTSPAVLLTVR